MMLAEKAADNNAVKWTKAESSSDEWLQVLQFILRYSFTTLPMPSQLELIPFQIVGHGSLFKHGNPFILSAE